MKTKLEKLTPEQEEKMAEVRQFWTDYIFSCKNSINKEQAKIGIDWLYKFCGYKEPIIIHVASPMGCQYATHLLKNIFKNQVWDQVGSQVRDQVRNQVGNQVRDQVWDQVRNQVGDQVWDQVGNRKIKCEAFSIYGNIWDYGWISFCEFFKQIGIELDNPNYESFKNLILSGVYDMIQLNGFCIVSDLPEKIKRNNRNQLHCEDGAAISFRDGYKLFFWNGVCVPEFWIKDKGLITKEVILKEDNAEKRRCLREILGAKEYYNIISDGNGLKLVDEDKDNQGNMMRLYETTMNDGLLNKKVQFIEVICPSTNRMYNIYPPNQKCTNVYQAKASTFGFKEKEFQPVLES